MNDKESTPVKNANQSQPLDLVYYLQKMIVNLNRSFDPKDLQDENLRSLLLAEIIECQQNLLLKANKTTSLVASEKSNITLNEIYDEWKVLAMVVDQICFFIYLSLLLLVISSIFVIYVFNLFSE